MKIHEYLALISSPEMFDSLLRQGEQPEFERASGFQTGLHELLHPFNLEIKARCIASKLIDLFS